MKVQRLLEKLHKFDPELEVIADDESGGHYPVKDIRSIRFRDGKDYALVVFNSDDDDE